MFNIEECALNPDLLSGEEDPRVMMYDRSVALLGKYLQWQDSITDYYVRLTEEKRKNYRDLGVLDTENEHQVPESASKSLRRGDTYRVLEGMANDASTVASAAMKTMSSLHQKSLEPEEYHRVFMGRIEDIKLSGLVNELSMLDDMKVDISPITENKTRYIALLTEEKINSALSTATSSKLRDLIASFVKIVEQQHQMVKGERGTEWEEAKQYHLGTINHTYNIMRFATRESAKSQMLFHKYLTASINGHEKGSKLLSKVEKK